MITLDEISPYFGELLRSAGWTPERRVEVNEWVRTLEQEGFATNPQALAVLESVGRLVVRMPPAGISPYTHELRFEPVRAATGESDRAEDWKKELGVDLFPIGEEMTSGNVLWIGSDGRFYYGRGFGLYLLGDSLRTAMDQLASPVSPLVLCAE
jgi:hypothetical protein